MKEIENKKVKIEEENDVIDFQMEFLHTKKKKSTNFSQHQSVKLGFVLRKI